MLILAHQIRVLSGPNYYHVKQQINSAIHIGNQFR
jgi:hypothetical protein